MSLSEAVCGAGGIFMLWNGQKYNRIEQMFRTWNVTSMTTKWVIAVTWCSTEEMETDRMRGQHICVFHRIDWCYFGMCDTCIVCTGNRAARCRHMSNFLSEGKYRFQRIKPWVAPCTTHSIDQADKCVFQVLANHEFVISEKSLPNAHYLYLQSMSMRSRWIWKNILDRAMS